MKMHSFVFKPYLRKLIKEKNKSFFIKAFIFKVRLLDRYRFVSHLQTLKEIEDCILKQIPGGYLRFGDGDIYLLNGNDDSYQEGGTAISKEIEEAFNIKSKTVYKSIPAHSRLFGYRPAKIEGALIPDIEAALYYYRVKKFFKGQRIYSAVALQFLFINNRELCLRFLRLIKSNDPIFIGNSEIDKSLVQFLFGGDFIRTPPINAYKEIDRIEKETVALLGDSFKFLVIAMGCSGRVLQKRLLLRELNVFIFDFGSLIDALNNTSSRSWIRNLKDSSPQEFLNGIYGDLKS